jgi:phosphatidylglycerophosphatase A
LRAFALIVASVCGLGYVPFAPGTFGSAAGLLVWALLPASVPVQLVALAAIFAIGAWSGTVAEERFGRTDPAQVVIDEVLGMLVTLFMNPVGWRGALVGFVLFRVFDVVKPFPADRLESVPGGIGVMADDAMAGIYANLTLRGLLALSIW